VSYVFNHANPNILPCLKQLFPSSHFALAEHALGPKVTAKPSRLDPHDWLALLHAFASNSNESQKKMVAGAAAKQQHEASQIAKQHRTRPF
jgi:hypothetical protein